MQWERLLICWETVTGSRRCPSCPACTSNWWRICIAKTHCWWCTGLGRAAETAAPTDTWIGRGTDCSWGHCWRDRSLSNTVFAVVCSERGPDHGNCPCKCSSIASWIAHCNPDSSWSPCNIESQWNARFPQGAVSVRSAVGSPLERSSRIKIPQLIEWYYRETPYKGLWAPATTTCCKLQCLCTWESSRPGSSGRAAWGPPRRCLPARFSVPDCFWANCY